jgi:hypothetical protein
MIGVELQSGHPPPGEVRRVAGLRVEKHTPRWLVYRLRLDTDTIATFTVPTGGVLVVVAGTAAFSDGLDATQGSALQLPHGTVTVRASGTDVLNAVLVPS